MFTLLNILLKIKNFIYINKGPKPVKVIENLIKVVEDRFVFIYKTDL